MGISGISHRSPPVVSGGRVAADDEVIYQREMKVTRRDAFLAEIEDWMGRYMTKSRVSDLVNEASGLEEVIEFLKHAPTPMNPDGKRTIYAHVFWGRTSRGDWWVRGLGFSTKASSESIETAKRRALRDRLEQKASARSEALPVPEWKVWFNPAE